MNIAQSTVAPSSDRNRNRFAACIRRCWPLVITLLCSGVLVTASAQATDNRWVGDGVANQWNFAASNWTNGLYHDGDIVLFDDSGSANPPVDITTLVAPTSVLVNATSTYTFGGVGGISGATALIKANTGVLNLATSNSYSGGTTISGGRLVVQHNNALGSVTGDTTVTNDAALDIDGSDLVIAEPLSLHVTYVSDGFAPTKGALNNLANSNTWSGPITLGTASGSGMVIRSAAGLLTLNSPTPIAGPNALLTAGDGDLLISSAIGSDVPYVQAYGPGILTLTGTNFSTSVNGGILVAGGGTVVTSPQGLGVGYLNCGGTLEINAGGGASVSNPLIVSGGKLRVSGGTVSYSRPSYPQISYSGTFETAVSSDQLIINSPILDGTSQAAYLYINGPGTVTINSGHASVFDTLYGYCYLLAGTLQLNNLNALGNPGAYNYISLSGGNLRTGVNAGGAFSTYGISVEADGTIQPGRSTAGAGVSNYFGDLSFFVGQLSVSPGANLNGGSTADLGFGSTALRGTDGVFNVQNRAGTNARVTLTGIVDDGFSPGPRSLIKSGNGTLVLLAANTYRGDTVVSNGTLRVSNLSGSATGSSNVTVLDGATLTGSGRISGPVSIQSGGTLAPGNSIGNLAISNSLTFAAGSTNLMEVNLNTRTNDVVTGLTNVTYGGTLVVNNLGSQIFTNGSIFKLFNSTSYGGSFAGIQPPTPGAGLQWDASSMAVDGRLKVIVANQPPVVVNPIPDQNGTYGSAFNFTVAANTFSDPDAGQMLSYTAGGLPPGVTFDGPTRAFSGTPADNGPYSVTVTATDNGAPPLNTNNVFNIVVGKAPLTVSADNTNRPYGDENPTFSGTLVGVANNDVITAAFTTTATPGSLPGNYPITPTLVDPGAKLANYTVTTNPGTLTVNGVSLVVGGSAGALTFCWPTNAAAFLPEYTDDLTPPVTWHEVVNGITTNGPNICLTVAPDATVKARYYHLRLP
jgi:autotransporter-associated beta strand protein